MDKLTELRKKYGTSTAPSAGVEKVTALREKYGAGTKEGVDNIAAQYRARERAKTAAPKPTFAPVSAEHPSGGATLNALGFLNKNSSVTPASLVKGELTSVGAKAEHQMAEKGVEQLKKDRAASRFDPTARNPESDQFKTNDQWTAEMKEADARRDKAAQNYYSLAGREAVGSLMKTHAALLEPAAEAAAEILSIEDTYRYGGWNNEATAALGAAQKKKASAIEALVAAGVSKEDAERAVDYMAQQKRTQAAAEETAATKKWASEKPGAATAMSVLTSPAQGLDFVSAALGNIGHNSTKGIENYKPLTGADLPITSETQALREGASADMSGVGKFLYDTGMSMADSALLVSTIGPAAGVVLGMSAASSATKDALERGGTNNQALMAGLAAGTAEMVFEKFSIDGLIKMKNVDSLRTVVTNTLKQAGVEASEEVFTEISNIITDGIIMGQNSNYSKAVQAYINSGKEQDEAKKLAMKDNLVQVALAGVGGFLSGGAMGGAFSGGQYVVNSASGSALKGRNENFDILAATLKLDPATEAYKTAAAINAALDADATGKNISNAQWGVLRRQYAAAVNGNLDTDDVAPEERPAVEAADAQIAENRARVQTVAEERAVQVGQAVAEQQAAAQQELTETQTRVQQRAEEAAARVQSIEQEAARMAEEAELRAKSTETANPATEPGTGGQVRNSVGTATTETESENRAVSGPSETVDPNVAQKRTVDYLNAVLPKGAARVELQNLDSGENGYFDAETNSIVLNAGKLTSQRAIVEYLGHELTHNADYNADRAMTDALVKVGKEIYGEDTWAELIEEKKRVYREFYTQKGKTNSEVIRLTTTSLMEEEVAADQMKELFASTNALERLAKADRGALQKIRDGLVSFRDRVISRVSKADSAAAQGAELRLEVENLIKAMDKALTKTAERGTDMAENTTQEVRRSVEGRRESTGGVSEQETAGQSVSDRVLRETPRAQGRDGRAASAERSDARGAAEKPAQARGTDPRGESEKRRGPSPLGADDLRVRRKLGDWIADAVVDPAPGSAPEYARGVVQDHHIECYVLSDAAMVANERKVAFTRGDTILLSDAITEELKEAAARHELVHVMKRTEFYPYTYFVMKAETVTIPGDLLDDMIAATMRHVRKTKPSLKTTDPNELSSLDFGLQMDVWDEFCAIAYGAWVRDAAAFRAEWGAAFVDLDYFMDELGVILDQFKARDTSLDRRYSVSTPANTNTPEFRAWFHDDSGELTNPDGTPKIFLRGDSFSGATRFPDGADNYSGGIFFSTKRDVADNYAEMNSSLGGLGVYSEEFIPRHLNSWNEAFQWVENGALGPLVALDREGPEWEFMTRTYDPDAELNGMKPFSKWKTIATYPNTAAGLERFNAEYGELMSRGHVQNPGFMRAYLTAQNTLVVDAQGRGWTNVDGHRKSTNETVTEAWGKGYDCVVIKNVVDGGMEGEFVMDEDGYEYYRQVPIDITIVRDSAQVKSVYNTGSFDRGNPDVRYSVSPDSVPDWDAQVNALLNGTFGELFWGDGRQSSSLYVKYEPTALLQELGLSDLPLIITQKHAWNTLQPRYDEDGKLINDKYHGITEEQFRRLPELIENPVAVFRDDEASNHPGGVNILTDERDSKGNPVFVTINPDRVDYAFDKKTGPAHFVNMFSRENWSEYLAANLENGGLLYVNKAKIDANPWLTQDSGPSLSTADGIDFDAIIGQKRPTVKPGERRFSIDGRPLADPLYSQMERVLSEYKGDKIGATSLISYLKNHGVKQEEIKWSGIEQFLDGKKSVTKDELFEFLRANELVIEDVVLSDDREGSLTREEQAELDAERKKAETIAGEIGRLAAEYNLQGVEDEYHAMMMRGDGRIIIPEWFFSRVQNEMYMVMAKGVADREVVPDRAQLRNLAIRNDDFGFDSSNQAVDAIRKDPAVFASNYEMSEADKAILLDYAEKKARNKAASEAWVEENKDVFRRILDLTTEGETAARARDKLGDIAYQRSVRLRPKYDWYATEPSSGRVNYREVLFRLPEVGGNLHSPHWEQTDVLAHTRLQDMVDAEGKKVLFVDEVQSDWHQAGRDDGYTPEEMTRIEREYREAQRVADEADRASRDVPAGPENDAEYREKEAKRREAVDAMFEAEQRYFDARAKYGHNTVPDAPYRDTWHEYVLKRILRMAAEGGYDKVAWTTGQMQAERYDLRQHLTEIGVANNGEGGYFIDAGEVYHDQTPEQVVALLGHDLGKRAMAKADELTPYEVEFLDGAELEVGGEGMKNFYDVGGKSSQNIPKFLNKYLKPWGVKVQSSLVGKDLTGSSAYRKGGMEEVMRIYQSGLHNQHDLWLVPGVDITDQMRDDLLYKGQPRYSVDNKPHTGGNTGNVNPDTGFERGSLADSFMRMWNVSAQDEALSMLEQTLSRLAQLQAEQAERARDELTRAVMRPRVTESVAERNRARVEALIDKYGMMPQTSAAQQEVRLPEQIDDETRVAGFVQTAMAAEVTNEVIGDELVQGILSGDEGLTYHRVGDRATLEQVDAEFERKGVTQMLEDWNNVFNGGEVTKLDIAKAEKLYVEACANKDVETAMKLAAEIAAAGTRAGQTVQAMTLLKKLTPSGQAYYIQKVVDRLNKDPRQKNPITLDEKLVKALLDARTREELEAAVDNLIQSIADQVPVTLADKWNTWRYFAMLGNPRTHIRNLMGNAIFTPARLAKDIIGTGLERILPVEQRTKSLTASKELRDFAKQDAEEMQSILRGGGKYNPADMIRDRRTIYKRAKWLNTATQKNSELLEREDWIFLSAAYQRALSHFLSARGADVASLSTKRGRKLLNEARDYAVNEAQRATYRDMSKLAGWLNNAKRQNKFAGVFLDGLVPFTKTPINIVKRGLEYSPLGLFKTGYDAVAKLRKGTMSGAEFIDELSANLTGTGVALLGVLLAHLGLLTGALGSDDEDKFKELSGEQAYSLKIPGVGSYTIDWMAPSALPLFVGAEIYNTITDDYSDVGAEQVLSAIGDGMASILEPMLSLSMLDGLNDALSANKFGDSEDAIWTLLSTVGTGYIAQGVPTIMGQLSRTLDPDRRTTFTQKGDGTVESMLKRFWQSSVQGKVPFYENEKMAYIDEWGRTDTTGSVLLRAFENFISPGYINADKGTAVETEIGRLAETLKDNAVYPNRAQKYFTVNKETYAMTQDEYQSHLIDRGQTSYQLVSDLIHDPVYGSLTDEQRAEVIADIYDYAAQNAKYHTTDAYPRDKWVVSLDAYVKSGGDAVDYLTMKVQAGSSDVVNAAYTRDDLSAAEMSVLILGSASASQRSPAQFSDPYAKGYVYEMNEAQQAKYTETFDELFEERFTELYRSEEYRTATAEERKELVKDLRAEVSDETKWVMSDWLYAKGIDSVLK